MTKPSVVRIPILPLSIVNAHLIVGPDGCVLVDTGLPGSARAIERVLASARRSFEDIRLIVVTHAHVDHAGAAREVQRRSGAPIVAHAGDLAHYERREPMRFCATGWSGRVFARTGKMFEPYAPFTPNILLHGEDFLELDAFGMRGRVSASPGHTAGSISVSLDSGVALAGDLVASGLFIGGIARLGRAQRPPFEDDPRAVALTLEKLLDSGVERFYVGHGGPLEAAEVRRHARVLRKLPPTACVASALV